MQYSSFIFSAIYFCNLPENHLKHGISDHMGFQLKICEQYSSKGHEIIIIVVSLSHGKRGIRIKSYLVFPLFMQPFLSEVYQRESTLSS